jgi:hypothetical protein
MTRFSTLTALTLTVLVVGVNAGVVAQPANRSYRVLSSKESKFQEELNREAGDGYRIVGGYASIELALLEPSVDGTTRTYVFAPNVETFLKEKKLQPGFRLVATTFSADEYWFSAVFEKVQGDEQPREYRLLKAGSVGALRKRLDAGEAGFGMVALAAGAPGAAALYEPRAAAGSVTLVASGNTGNLRQELQAAGGKGQCVLASDGIKEAVYAMEACASGSGPRSYEIVATTKTETLERELNAASARGFRLVPQSLLGIEKRVPMMGSYNYETIAILEHTADALPVTYRVLGTARLSTFEKELRTATADGFTLAAFTIGPKEVVAVLEKTTSVRN